MAHESPNLLKMGYHEHPLHPPEIQMYFSKMFYHCGNLDWADKDYQLVAAHEVGHPILTLAANREYSWSHEGTSGTFGGDNGTYAPVPKTGEMNLMKYYEDASVNMKYARSIASESDVKNLIYISKRH